MYPVILKNRNFSLLVIGQFISNIGDRLAQIALIRFVYTTFKDGNLALGYAQIMFFSILPVFLINPIAGVYVDRWNKRKTMYVCDILRGIIVIMIVLGFINKWNIINIYLLIFILYSVGRFFNPSKMSILPYLVKGEEIVMGNSLISITANIGAVLGFSIGGIIVEYGGEVLGFTIDAFTFFISAILILLIDIKEGRHFRIKDLVNLGKDVIKKEKSVWKEFKEGLHYLFSNQSTLFNVKSLSLFFASLGVFYIVFFVFIQDIFRTATMDAGIFIFG